MKKINRLLETLIFSRAKPQDAARFSLVMTSDCMRVKFITVH